MTQISQNNPFRAYTKPSQTKRPVGMTKFSAPRQPVESSHHGSDWAFSDLQAERTRTLGFGEFLFQIKDAILDLFFEPAHTDETLAAMAAGHSPTGTKEKPIGISGFNRQALTHATVPVTVSTMNVSRKGHQELY